jgi:hypothetical protein
MIESAAWPVTSGSPRCLRASTTAPTAATSSRIDAASNGSRNFCSSSSPIAPGDPKLGPTFAPSESSWLNPEPTTAIVTTASRAVANSAPAWAMPPVSLRGGSCTPPM